jgi:hypothetical protein
MAFQTECIELAGEVYQRCPITALSGSSMLLTMSQGVNGAWAALAGAAYGPGIGDVSARPGPLASTMPDPPARRAGAAGHRTHLPTPGGEQIGLI